MESEAAESLIEVVGSDGSDPVCSEAVTRVKKLLFRRMLVGIKDGRFFLGTFHCIDNKTTSFFKTRSSIGALAGTRLLRWSSAASTVSFSSLVLVGFLAMWGVLLKNR